MDMGRVLRTLKGRLVNLSGSSIEIPPAPESDNDDGSVEVQAPKNKGNLDVPRREARRSRRAILDRHLFPKCCPLAY